MYGLTVWLDQVLFHLKQMVVSSTRPVGNTIDGYYWGVPLAYVFRLFEGLKVRQVGELSPALRDGRGRVQAGRGWKTFSVRLKKNSFFF